MTTAAERIAVGYQEFIDTFREDLVQDWFLMNSPWPTLAIIALYVVFVKKIGPEMMKNAKPLDLKRVIFVYNLIQVVLNLYLFSRIVGLWNDGAFTITCQKKAKPHSLFTTEVVSLNYLYLLIKFSELFDTIAFVLRKKFDQVSNLHVFHHSIMPMNTWVFLRFFTGIQTTYIVGWLNTFVHIVMYTYYLLASLGVNRKYLWWKTHVTKLQLLQFLLILAHSYHICTSECVVPEFFGWYIGTSSLLFFCLFINFYIKAYLAPRDKPVRQHCSLQFKES